MLEILLPVVTRRLSIVRLGVMVLQHAPVEGLDEEGKEGESRKEVVRGAELDTGRMGQTGGITAGRGGGKNERRVIMIPPTCSASSLSSPPASSPSPPPFPLFILNLTQPRYR